MMPVICFMILPGLELSVKEILGAHSNTLSKKSFSKIASKCLFNVNPSHPIQCRPVNALALKLWPDIAIEPILMNLRLFVIFSVEPSQA